MWGVRAKGGNDMHPIHASSTRTPTSIKLHDEDFLGFFRPENVAGGRTNEFAAIFGAVELDGVLAVAMSIREHEGRIAFVHRFPTE